jgi:hypothetical protein
LGFISIKKPEIWKTELSVTSFTPEWIGGFSAKNNVIHFIFDAFQSDIFDEIIENKPDHYSKAFDGFTFFRETTGIFPTTYLSVPAILSGKVYQNDIPIVDFLRQTLTEKSITNVLYNHGYDVDIIPANKSYCQGNFTQFYMIPDPYTGTIKDYRRAKAALMMDLVLFRHTPHYIKQAVYGNQRWFIQKFLVQNEHAHYRYFGHEAFLSDIISAMSPNRNKPVYKFYHFMTTHVPLVVNKDCQYAGAVLPNTRENVLIQSKCVLDHFANFLIKLKSLGIYDNSLIIMQADHGSVAPVELKGQNTHPEGNVISANVVSSALPLLLIKPPASKGPLRISDAPVMLTDVPATINSLLHLNEIIPGQSVFEIKPNQVRERKFFDYRWKHANWQSDFLPPLTEYIITGSVFNRASWRLAKQSPLAGNISFKAQKIDFGTDYATNFLRQGWSGNEKSDKEGITYTWAMGNSASIYLSLPKEKTVKLTANINSLIFPEPQIVTVKVDNKEIGRWKMLNSWKWQQYSAIINSDNNRPAVSVVEFVFSQHRIQEKDSRPLAVLFESITLTDAN